MSRNAIEVGAFSWARIQRLYDADAVVHWQRCEAEGLQCPQEVFVQLFHAEDVNAETKSPDEMPSGPNLLSLDSVRGIDWGRVRWELQEMSGIALRHMRVDREFQHALDEARDQATQFGIVDEREIGRAHV